VDEHPFTRDEMQAVRGKAFNHFIRRGLFGLQAFHLSSFVWPFPLFFLLALLPVFSIFYGDFVANSVSRSVSSGVEAGT
jgi:hypothetical protein